MDVKEKGFQAIRDAFNALDKKFGQDIVIMDISKISIIADYFIVTGAGNTKQIQALSAAAEEALSKHGYSLNHTEGLRTANWVLMDFGDIIVHIFDKESREYYNIERIWGDAEFIELN